MNKKSEIKMTDGDIVINESVVKGNILPQISKELSRNVKIESDVTIEGSVFGNRIEISGDNIDIKGAVFANSELYISSSSKGDIKFEKAVASSENVSVLVNSGKVIFASDINAQTIKLKNCYVGGSLFAKEISLENCVVLGGAFASNQLTIDGSLTGTFNASSTEMSGINYLLYPAAFSVEPISILPKTELYNLSLAHLGALYKEEKENEGTGKIKVDFENDRQKTVLVKEDESTITINSYSVSGKVLIADMTDLEKLENHFLIESGALGSQILKTYSLTKKDNSKSKDLTLENISQFFFDILNGKISIQEMSGEISFKDLKKKLEN